LFKRKTHGSLDIVHDSAEEEESWRSAKRISTSTPRLTDNDGVVTIATQGKPRPSCGAVGPVQADRSDWVRKYPPSVFDTPE